MKEIEGNFSGEIKLDPIQYSKILMRIVTKNNETSGKITVPYEYIDEKVVVLFPKKLKNRKEKKK